MLKINFFSYLRELVAMKANITNMHHYRKHYIVPQAYVEQAGLEDMLLVLSSSEGEDLTTGELDPWSVGGEY